MLTSSLQYNAKPSLLGWKIEIKLESAMGAMPQSKSTSLSFPITLALLHSPRSNGTVDSWIDLLTSSLATCTQRFNRPVLGSLAASAVLFVTRITEHPELAHMETLRAATGLVGT